MKKRLSLLLFIGLAFGATAQNDKGFEISKNLEIFANVYKNLHTNYVDDVDPGKTMKVAIDAMLASMDPYTNYYAESDQLCPRVESEMLILPYKRIFQQAMAGENRPVLVAPAADLLEKGGLNPVKQDDSLSNYAPMLTKELCPIDWSEPAQKVHNKVRGLYSWPCATAGGTLVYWPCARTKLPTAAHASSRRL